MCVTRHVHAISLGNLASLHEAMGDHRAALPLMQQALKLREEVLGKRQPDYATSLNNLALLLQAMGDTKAALPFMEDALGIVSSTLRDNAAVQSDRQQLAAADAARANLDVRLGIPDGPKGPAASGHVLAWKGQVLTRQQQRRLFLRLASDPASRDAARRLEEATRALAALRASPTAAKAVLERLEREQDEAQAKPVRKRKTA